MRDYYLRIKFSFSSCSPAAIDEPWERQDLSPEPVVSLFLMVNETDGALGAVCRCRSSDCIFEPMRGDTVTFSK